MYDYFGFLRFADKKRRRAEGGDGVGRETGNVQRDSGIFASIRGKTWFERVKEIVEKRETLATSHYVHSEKESLRRAATGENREKIKMEVSRVVSTERPPRLDRAREYNNSIS